MEWTALKMLNDAVASPHLLAFLILADWRQIQEGRFLTSVIHHTVDFQTTARLFGSFERAMSAMSMFSALFGDSIDSTAH